jgi:hypothetical protein
MKQQTFTDLGFQITCRRTRAPRHNVELEDASTDVIMILLAVTFERGDYVAIGHASRISKHWKLCVHSAVGGLLCELRRLAESARTAQNSILFTAISGVPLLSPIPPTAIAAYHVHPATILYKAKLSLLFSNDVVNRLVDSVHTSGHWIHPTEFFCWATERCVTCGKKVFRLAYDTPHTVYDFHGMPPYPVPMHVFNHKCAPVMRWYQSSVRTDAERIGRAILCNAPLTKAASSLAYHEGRRRPRCFVLPIPGLPLCNTLLGASGLTVANGMQLVSERCKALKERQKESIRRRLILREEKLDRLESLINLELKARRGTIQSVKMLRTAERRWNILPSLPPRPVTASLRVLPASALQFATHIARVHRNLDLIEQTSLLQSPAT